MKTKSIFFVILIMLPVLCLVGCVSKYYPLLSANVSENRKTLYAYNDEEINITFMSGTREKEYILNGYHTDNIDFGIITFQFYDKTFEVVDDAMYVLLVGTARYDGLLEQNPYDGSFVADIKKIVDDDLLITAKIVSGEYHKEVDLVNLSKEFVISSDKALQIACKELGNKIDSFIENELFAGEVYIKIINDKDISADEYYWYVSILGKKGLTYSLLIDPTNGDILATNNTN